MIFSKVDCESTQCPQGFVKVFNGGSATTRVSSEGHLIEPGTCACVSSEDETMLKAISRGRISMRDATPVAQDKKPKRRNNPPKPNSKRCCP